MIKLIVYIIIALASWSSAASQSVRKEGNFFIVDCSTMPYNARRVEPVKPHNEKSLHNRVPALLAITPHDVAVKVPYWNDAKKACATYTGPNGGEAGKWRLPTQRELIRVNILKNKLEALAGFTKFTTKPVDESGTTKEGLYWTCTEYSTTPYQVWTIRIEEYGLTVPYTDGDNGYFCFVRCVRDY